MTLAEIGQEQRRLAYHAAPTALAVNMHFYWTGLAADVWRSGDKSTEWMLKEAANGAVFAAGHGEGGNDLPLLLSTTKAEKVDGGYKFTGHKMFGSLSPVWTFLGIKAWIIRTPPRPKSSMPSCPATAVATPLKRPGIRWECGPLRAMTPS